jgi:hypothetical protein
MIKGFAYIAWLIENHPFADAQAKSPRYIAQEADRLAALNPQPSTQNS